MKVETAAEIIASFIPLNWDQGAKDFYVTVDPADFNLPTKDARQRIPPEQEMFPRAVKRLLWKMGFSDVKDIEWDYEEWFEEEYFCTFRLKVVLGD